MSQEDPQLQARIKEILARRAMPGAGKSAAVSMPSVVEAKPSAEPRVQEIPAQRAMPGAGQSAVLSKPGVVEAAKPKNEPSIQEILARRAMVGAGKPAAVSKPGVAAGTVKPGAEVKAGTESRANPPVDLKSIESHMMFSIAALGQANNSLAKVDKELQVLITLFKAVLGVGAVGVVLVVGGILRLTGHI